jgi:hypothetical protein
MKRPESTPLMPEPETQNQFGTAMQTQSTEANTSAESRNSTDGGLSPSVQKHIGNLLKVSFQELLTEPVPDRFANLLDQLEQAEKKGK